MKAELKELLEAVDGFVKYVNEVSDPVEDEPSVVRLKEAQRVALEKLSEATSDKHEHVIDWEDVMYVGRDGRDEADDIILAVSCNCGETAIIYIDPDSGSIKI